MKRVLLALCLLTAVLLAGCSPAEILTPTVATFTTEPPTESTAPEMEWISQEQAMLAGFVVMQSGDVRHNQQVWMDFLDLCEQGKEASVRLVQFSEDGTQNVHDLTFRDGEYILRTRTENQTTEEVYLGCLWLTEELGEAEEPYDRAVQWALTGEKILVLYTDRIAEPDYAGITAMNLHLKEGEPPLKTLEGESCNRLLELLTGAEYMLCPPQEYLLGVKLILPKAEGELVLEMDLNQGFFRFGEQYYRYGDTSDALLEILGWDQWPEEVKKEYGLQ